MAKVNVSSTFSNLKTLGDLTRYLGSFADALLRQVNGNLNFGSNISASQATVSFTQANTDTMVPHGLNRSPTGFIVVSPSAAMRIFRGSNPWTNKVIYLQSDAVGTATVFVI